MEDFGYGILAAIVGFGIFAVMIWMTYIVAAWM